MTKNSEELKTDIEQFKLFHELLLLNAPNAYKPFYFVCMKENKDPLPGISWKKSGLGFKKACNLMERGYNIGIAGTDYDSLCILDVDEMEKVPDKEVKPTLQVFSRKRIGRHNYYFSQDGSAKKNISANVGELRSSWQYVLTPGSYVPCASYEIAKMPQKEQSLAGCYTVEGKVHAVDITFEELPTVYKARHYELLRTQAAADKKAAERKHRKVPKIIKYKSELWDLNIHDVSGVLNTGWKKVPMPSEIHGSGTGHNCSVNNNLLHCWRHEVTHCALSYLGVLAGVGTCEQLGKPHGGGSFGFDFQDGYTIYTIWKHAKKMRLIPDDDPVPHSSLVYYALSKKLCKKEDLVDGRVPAFSYTFAPLLAKKEGINFGRK